MKMLLQEIGKLHLCEFVYNGEEAVLKFAEFAESDIAVSHILTDYMMPRVNGLQAVKKIKEFVTQMN